MDYEYKNEEIRGKIPTEILSFFHQEDYRSMLTQFFQYCANQIHLEQLRNGQLFLDKLKQRNFDVPNWNEAVLLERYTHGASALIDVFLGPRADQLAYRRLQVFPYIMIDPIDFSGFSITPGFKSRISFFKEEFKGENISKNSFGVVILFLENVFSLLDQVGIQKKSGPVDLNYLSHPSFMQKSPHIRTITRDIRTCLIDKFGMYKNHFFSLDDFDKSIKEFSDYSLDALSDNFFVNQGLHFKQKPRQMYQTFQQRIEKKNTTSL